MFASPHSLISHLSTCWKSRTFPLTALASPVVAEIIAKKVWTANKFIVLKVVITDVKLITKTYIRWINWNNYKTQSVLYLFGLNQHPGPYLETRKQELSFGIKIKGICCFIMGNISFLSFDQGYWSPTVFVVNYYTYIWLATCQSKIYEK